MILYQSLVCLSFFYSYLNNEIKTIPWINWIHLSYHEYTYKSFWTITTVNYYSKPTNAFNINILQNMSKLLISRLYFHGYFCLFNDTLKYSLHIQTYCTQELDGKHSAYINKHEMSLRFSILISDTNNSIISHFELNSLEKDNSGRNDVMKCQ